MRRLGAAAVDMCHVALGIAEAYWEYRLKPWDMAAGVLVFLLSLLSIFPDMLLLIFEENSRELSGQSLMHNRSNQQIVFFNIISCFSLLSIK